MALREDHQALLDVFCHCYEVLLEHLDLLDREVGDGFGYRFVRECVDIAANRLGSAPLETTDRQVVCRDFLRRVRGAMEQNLAADSPAFAAFSDYATAVEAPSEIAYADLVEWQHAGEELSRSCYGRLLPADAAPLCMSVGGVELEPATEFKMLCVPQKEQGQGRVQCGFASDRFSFADYVNLPFYFFHEYLSHLHSAPMFTERHKRVDAPFAEGWLIYYARLSYQRALFHEPHPTLDYSLHRDHYVQQYFQEILDPVKKPMVYAGYEQARRGANLLGKARFERVTLLVASTPYDVFTPLAPDLHGEFVRRVRDWLRRVVTLSPQERESRVATLDALLDRHDPVHGLMEWLTC